jgi:hypothetical protein
MSFPNRSFPKRAFPDRAYGQGGATPPPGKPPKPLWRGRRAHQRRVAGGIHSGAHWSKER